jgi:hypothetical protein
MTTLVLQVQPLRGPFEMFKFVCDSVCVVINRYREQFDVVHVQSIFLPNSTTGYLFVIVEPDKDIDRIIESICKSIQLLDSITIDSEVQIIEDGMINSS